MRNNYETRLQRLEGRADDKLSVTFLTIAARAWLS